MAAAVQPGLQANDEILVRYNVGGRPEWHVRLLLSQISLDEWVICTPDFDIYNEDYSDNRTFRSVRQLAPGRNAPPGVDAAHVYDFDDAVVGAARAQLLHEGNQYAQRECVRRGLVFPFVLPAAIAAPVAGDLAP